MSFLTGEPMIPACMDCGVDPRQAEYNGGYMPCGHPWTRLAYATMPKMPKEVAMVEKSSAELLDEFEREAGCQMPEARASQDERRSILLGRLRGTGGADLARSFRDRRDGAKEAAAVFHRVGGAAHASLEAAALMWDIAADEVEAYLRVPEARAATLDAGGAATPDAGAARRDAASVPVVDSASEAARLRGAIESIVDASLGGSAKNAIQDMLEIAEKALEEGSGRVR